VPAQAAFPLELLEADTAVELGAHVLGLDVHVATTSRPGVDLMN
jgi:hypothetical protein